MKVLERPLLQVFFGTCRIGTCRIAEIAENNCLFSLVFLASVDHQHCNINFIAVFLPSHQYPKIPLGYFNMEALTVSLCQECK